METTELTKVKIASPEKKSKIRTELLKNPLMDRAKLAKKYNVSNGTVGAIYTHTISKKQKVEPPIVIKQGVFKNQEGVKKEQARIRMVLAIAKGMTLTTNKLILTLSAADAILEQKILSDLSPKFKFIGCEFDKEVYNKMLITIASKNLPFIGLHNGEIGEVIREAKPNQYSNLILDYCGQFGRFHNDIAIAINNDIMEVGGAMCITLNKRISFGTEDIYEKMEQLNPRLDKNEETRSEHALRTFINRIGGFKYAIEETFNYHDTSNMILMIVRRIS